MKKKNKKLSTSILITITLLVTLFTLDSYSVNAQLSAKDSRIPVVVSFNAMKEFTDIVGGNKVKVKVMIPQGTEPHEFEPSAKDLTELGSCKVFVYNGSGMENWAGKAIASAARKDMIAVDASMGYKQIKIGNGTDPHVWLSIKGGEYEAGRIRDALVKADPLNKKYYDSNYSLFYSRLEKLNREYKVKFSKVKNKSFVTGHAAFGYLCRDFGLKQNSVEDVFADGEPSAKNMKLLIDYCKANKIKTIFAEDMVSPKVSQTLADEVGAKVLKIYTVESREDNKDYLKSLEYNLNVIYNSIK